MSKILVIESINRNLNSTSSSSFNINLGYSVNNIRRLKLLECTMPNSIYNITSLNNALQWVHSSTFNYTIPVGSYSISALLSTIQSGMNGLDANSYVCTYNTNQQTITISGSAAFVINFGNSTSPWRILGFVNLNTSSGTSQTGTNVVGAERPYNIFLRVDKWPGVCISDLGQLYTFVIPKSVNSGDVNIWTEKQNFDQIIEWPQPYSFSNLNFQLFADGNSLSLNGSEWSIILGVC